MRESVLILGAGGFIGRHLTRALSARGQHVIAASGSKVEFASTNVETHVGNLQQPEDFLPLIARSRAVVHLASASTPASSACNPMLELQANLQPTLALLVAMQGHPQSGLIYVSSGGSLYAAPGDESANEQAQVEPRSYHGAGKAAAEHFIRAWCAQYAGIATIIRPSNIYGPGQTERAGFAVVPTALGKLLRDEELTVWGDGSAIRDYLFVEDFVALCVAVLETPMNAGAHTLNASSGIGISLNELFAAIEVVTGRTLKRIYEKQRTIDAKRVVMDSTATRNKYGWSPTTNLPDGLRRTWDWLTITRH